LISVVTILLKGLFAALLLLAGAVVAYFVFALALIVIAAIAMGGVRKTKIRDFGPPKNWSEPIAKHSRVQRAVETEDTAP